MLTTFLCMANCVRCGSEKPPESFYGGDRSCKECRKALALANYHAKRQDPEWVKVERARGRDRMRKKWREDPEHREKKRLYRRGRTEPQDPRKKAARAEMWRAIRMGTLTPAATCERCGHDFSEYRRESHHPDYDKPLEVEWLCCRCHGKEHRK